jgi:hypothetical protein
MTHYWLLVGALAAAASIAFWFGCRTWRKSRVVADTPVSKVRSAVQGYVELRGRGAPPPGAEIRGPLTRRPCAWWRYEIQERRRSRRSDSWETVEQGTSEAPFVLDDGTGQCLVDPRGADVEGQTVERWTGDSRYPSVRLPDATGLLGVLQSLFVMAPYRYVEQRLESGSHLYAIGQFRTAGGVVTGDADAQTGSLLHEWKSDQAALLARFDGNHDGRLDATEWEQARVAAREQVAAARRSQAPAAKVNALADPGDGRVFLLAACDRETLTRRFRAQAIASITGFLGATAALAWLLIRV